MQPSHAEHAVSAAFGADNPPVSYDGIAAQIRGMKPSALRTDQLDDVLTLIEFMRDNALVIHDRNIENAKVLAARELEISKRERAVALRQRTVEAVLKTRTVKYRGWVRRMLEVRQ